MPALDDLLRGLEQVDDDVFRPLSEGPMVFGGAFLARALQAAGRTVDGMPPHAIEGRFLQGARTEVTPTLHVERVREGKLLRSRRVEIREGAQLLFTLDASFGRPPENEVYERPAPVFPPNRIGRSHQWSEFDEAIGFTGDEHMGALPGEDAAAMGRSRRAWAVPNVDVPEDPLTQAAVLALYSDTRTGMTAKGSIDRDPLTRVSSLNHAMWFHRRLPPGPMLTTWTPIITLHRLSLVEGSMHAPDGRRIATFVQELLLRELRTGLPATTTRRVMTSPTWLPTSPRG